ncbi:hypothetical protein EMCG_01645 [[Emmonsia] crescens]|uniref:Uncharacterized protein n=1 Tax=[Emmonsia] crescens TaxID=73230 RepID=A0A0G2I110_9EURO|nr:hypothetical protein EMCG_01645 [Emmonsia crescens UAMH 3008]
MQRYIQTSTCRAQVLSQFLDNEKGEGSGCTSDTSMCDQCWDGNYAVQALFKAADRPAAVSIIDAASSASTASTASVVEVNEDESDESDDVDDLKDLRAGRELLHAVTRRQAQGMAEYIACLEAWCGVCMICYHLPRAASGQESHARHTLQACPNPKRFNYFDAKRRAMKEGQQQDAAIIASIHRRYVISKDLDNVNFQTL